MMKNIKLQNYEDSTLSIQSITTEDPDIKVVLPDLKTFPILLQSEDDYKQIKVYFMYSQKKSKIMDVKFITLWTNDTFLPLPIYIYDKSVQCSFQIADS